MQRINWISGKPHLLHMYGDNSGYLPIFRIEGKLWVGKSFKQSYKELAIEEFGSRLSRHMGVNSPAIGYLHADGKDYIISRLIYPSRIAEIRDLRSLGQDILIPRLASSGANLLGGLVDTINIDLNLTNFLIADNKLYQIDFSCPPRHDPDHLLMMIDNFGIDLERSLQQAKEIKAETDIIERFTCMSYSFWPKETAEAREEIRDNLKNLEKMISSMLFFWDYDPSVGRYSIDPADGYKSKR